MCGIIGYAGFLPAAIESINALEVLEYRGYDSAGLAISNGKVIEVEKIKGEVSTLKKRVFKDNRFLNPGFFLAVAHTRWATHGKPSKRNAHPHLSCDGKVAVVHNGIIENYQELKQGLKGHKFTSETDSEVIAHLIEEELKQKKSLVEAVKHVQGKLKGTYGIAVLCAGFDYLVGARFGSPLKVGIGKNGTYISSDVNALIGRAGEYFSLNDGDAVVISQKGYKIYGVTEKKTLSFARAEVSKGSYPTFMLKEIYEQEKSVRMALTGSSGKGRLEFLKEWIERGRPENGLGDLGSIDPSYLKEAKKIAFIGAGTSYHAALCAAYSFSKMPEIEANAFLSSEALHTLKDTYDLYVFISQSGETADTINVLRKVNEWDKPTFGICNVPGSTIAEETDGGKFIYAGPELSVASTKAFTSQLAVLFLLNLYFRAVNGYKVSREISELRRIPEKIGYCLKKVDKKAKEASFKIAGNKYIIYIGRGRSYPIALEGALKIKEISYIHSIAYAGGELKHGPLALVEKGTPVIAINMIDENFDDMEGNIKEVEARGGLIFCVSDSNGAFFQVPSTLPMFSPIISVLPLQLLAHHTAMLKGLNIDKPRNLAKSVTVK
ncbi:MAG: glutamine--fructose-6-phosphate transaminase (isomerizing) [Candidatus Anstonellales archaeon]